MVLKYFLHVQFSKPPHKQYYDCRVFLESNLAMALLPIQLPWPTEVALQTWTSATKITLCSKAERVNLYAAKRNHISALPTTFIKKDLTNTPYSKMAAV